VSGPADRPSILIVDEDIGFLWWLGELFNDSGYRSIPALSCTEALERLDMLTEAVDLLVVNPSLPGVAVLLETLTRIRMPKIVLILDAGGSDPIPGISADATLERPSGRPPVSYAEWRQKVQKILTKVGFRAAS